MAIMVQIKDLKAKLIERLEDVLVALLGEPETKNDTEWRWGKKGSLSVDLGSKRGCWFSHEDEDGGGITKLLAWKWKLDPDTDRDEINQRAIALLEGLPKEKSEPFSAKENPEDNKWSSDEAIKTFWEPAGELSEQHGKAYLRSRKIDPAKIPTSSVRELSHKSNKAPGTNSFPAVNCLLTDMDDSKVGVHAIRCPHGVKLDKASKITSGKLKGAAIKLPGRRTENDEIVLVEGPEDAMSVYQETGIETWAVCSLGNLSAAPVRAGQRVVVIGDADEKSEDRTRAACTELAERCAGVRLIFPSGDHKDPNDILVADPEKAAEVFRDLIERAEPVQGEAKPETERRRLISAAEMLANVGPTDWLIERYLELDTVSLMYGQPKTGKTFVALDMALSIAAGIPFHGCPVKQGAVIYVAGEGHGGLARRVKAWCLEHNVDPKTLPIYFSTRGQALTEIDEAAALLQEIADCAEQSDLPIRMIVIDTLNRNFGGADENSTKDMTAFIANIDLMRTTHDATVLILHHSGHGTDNRARGSSALFAAVDANMKVTKRDNNILLTMEVMKDAETPSPISFETLVVEINEPGDESASSLVLREGKLSATEVARAELFAKHPELRSKSKTDKFEKRMQGILSSMYDGETDWRRLAGTYNGKSKGTFGGYIKRLRSAGLVCPDKLTLTEEGKNVALSLDAVLGLRETLSGGEETVFDLKEQTGQNPGQTGAK